MQNFEEKVRSMSAKEIIMAMVDALTHPPVINIDMATFGSCRKISREKLFGLIKPKYKCFGCAATNTICQISGIVFNDERICEPESRAKFIKSDKDFLITFEKAIDVLRKGQIDDYNYYARYQDFAKIVPGPQLLPKLQDDYTNIDLQQYKLLAEAQ